MWIAVFIRDIDLLQKDGEPWSLDDLTALDEQLLIDPDIMSGHETPAWGSFSSHGSHVSVLSPPRFFQSIGSHHGPDALI
jgi:hypothetical protein